ncbi:MAG: PilZ domain-containing protein [Deltaproteobacteria bacterium]|nr:PilZ domain-containing protein [Deltaproteobacteria bacterium]
MLMTQERRRRTRVSLELSLLVACDGKQVRGVVHDLSLKGLACSTDDRLEAGKDCDLVLELDSGVRIRVHGRIIRDGRDSAIDFVRMDEVSFGHLRNLVRLYAEDADAVDDELRTPAFGPES